VRRRWSRLAGVVALVATLGAAAAAFQIDAEVVVEVSTAPTGLWIPAPITGEIVRVDAASGTVTARVPVGDPGAELDISEGVEGVVVVDRTAGRVSLVDPALQEVAREVRTAIPRDGLVDIGPESVVVASQTELTVVDLAVTDASTVAVSGILRSATALGTGAMIENGEERVEIDAAGVVGVAQQSPGRLVRVGREVVIVTADGVEDQDGVRLSCLEFSVESPDFLVGAAGELIIVVEGSIVQIADIVSGECSSVDLGLDAGELGRPVIAGDRVYVPERMTGIVYIVDPWQRSVQSHAVFSPGDLRLRSRGDFVAAYDTESAVAALLNADGVVRFVATVGSGIQAVFDERGPAAVLGADQEASDAALEGGDGIRASNAAPVIDAEVLATALQDPADEPEVPPDDDLVANFAFSSTTVAVGESVRFVDGSTGTPDSWAWDFGDGTGAEGPEVEKTWSEPGTYPVTLTISRGEKTAEISLAITVVPVEVALPPVADFAFSTLAVDVGDSVDFEDRSDGEIDRWRWDFGDGSSATAPNVRKAWGKPGRYTVSLTVANEQGSDTTSVIIEVVESLRPPVAVIEVSTTDVDLGAPLGFVGSSSTDPARFLWDFGDGHASTGSEVVHVFLEEGTVTVRLAAQNDAGSSAAQVEITVTPPTLPPTAIVAALPAIVEVGDAIVLTSLSTNAPDSEEWSFGDGDSASGNEVTHTWTAEGTYLLNLTASNSAGTDTSTATVEVVAELPAPIARIGAFDASPSVGDATVFFDASIDATSWLWDFGDGVTSTAPDSIHTFATAGQKVVTLTVSNRNGSDSTSVIVEPRLVPTAAFVVSSTAVRAGDEVTFTDQSVNAVSWFWDLGDDSFSGLQNPLHAYAAAGTYSVLLTVESATGDSATFGPLVISVDPAAPKLSGIRTLPDNSGSITTLTTATFEAQVDATSGPIDEYQIDFGDGSAVEFSSSPQFGHVYGTNGIYEVRMLARGPLGDWSNAVSRSFTVVDPLPPLIRIASSVPASALVGAVALVGEELNGSGPIDNWRWEVTGGGSLWNYTGRTAVHNFDAAGVYVLRLIAEGPVVDTVVSRDITITLPPPPTIVSLTATPSPATVGVVVNFSPVVTGSVSTWEWDFEGGGYVSLGPNGAHIFNTAGSQLVRLRVTGPFGRQDERTVALTISARPTPSTPAAEPVGTIVTGTTVALSSTDGSGLGGLTWNWTVSNGATTFTYANAGSSITHLFALAGSWTVTVTATDALNVSGSAVSFVTVEDPVPPLVASFESPSAGPLQIQFKDTSTGPPVDSWSWDFGDALATGDATVAEPLVTYPAPGTYSVTLTVGSGSQPTDSLTKSVTVT
jgi:PKD repeat protein